MTKLLAFGWLLLVSGGAWAQQEATEAFINQAYLAVVPAHFTYYNLADSSLRLPFDRYSLDKYEQDSLLRNYPDFPLTFFWQAAATNRAIAWNKYDLVKARVYPTTLIPHLPVSYVIYRAVPFQISRLKLDSLNKAKKYEEILVPAKARWSHKRFLKASKQAEYTYYQSLKPEETEAYYFSAPLLSPDGRYAVVALHQSGRGATYIFKKDGNKWVQIFLFNRVVS